MADTYCRTCKRLVGTGNINLCKNLVSCSFLLLPVCNEHATQEDVNFITKRIKEHKTTRTMEQWIKEVQNMNKKYNKNLKVE